MKYFKYIILILLSFCSCSVTSMFDFEYNEDFLDYKNTISEIRLYNMDRSVRMISMHKEIPIYSFEYIKKYSDLLIFKNYSIHSNQLDYITSLLYYAKRVNINVEENMPKAEDIGGAFLIKNSGCIIELYDWNNNLMKTYVMSNSLDVFYEKGKEGVYYAMPKSILNNFYIKEKEFLNEYRKLEKNNRHKKRQLKSINN